MRSGAANVKIGLVAAMVAGCLAAPAVSKAQAGTPTGATGAPVNVLTGINSGEGYQEILEKNMRNNLGDPAEEAAYKAFHETSSRDVDKKISLGQAFVNKYPSSFRTESVYAELAQTYYSKQDVANFYACADKGIALKPDDPVLLAMVGWVAPRAYKRDDPDADNKLDKGETYAKRAILLMDTLPKPAGMSDQQFTQFKGEELETAHSGLGLIYFRRGEFEDSVKELQQATQNAANPDPTDFYVLGASFQNLNRYKDAADAFNRCAQIAGPLQQDCKQSASSALKQAAQTK